ncbi:MAG: hypothetical protein IJU37_05720 [Desulfovibrio sp.]|nr:hypothetical protein [Desulfovibrio sp.]
MPQSLCILHANCQGDMLLPILKNTPAFTRYFHVRRYINYTKEAVDARDLERCSLFLYQYLPSKWKEHSSEQMLASLPSHCKHVEIPNLFFKGYWPFWQSGGPINFTNSLLEKLLQKSDPQTTLRLYLKGSPAILGDQSVLEAIAEDSLAHEELKEKNSLIHCTPLLRERWRDQQLFLTINHPGPDLVLHIADSLLQLLELGSIPPCIRSTYVHPFNDFWLPIHPAVGRMLKLSFTEPERRYTIFQNRLTHREYVLAYLACRTNNVHDLLSFLENLDPCYVAKLPMFGSR